MPKDKYPTTTAILALRKVRAEFEPHLYPYVERGGTRASAQALSVDEHCVVKTIVLETELKKPLICLMHGDQEVSTKKLARHLGCKSVTPADPSVAARHTGYQVGGTSPFGTRKVMPIFVQSSIMDLEKIYINGGARGFLVALSPLVLKEALSVQVVDAAAR